MLKERVIIKRQAAIICMLMSADRKSVQMWRMNKRLLYDKSHITVFLKIIPVAVP